ncbi:hypothetical protein ACLKMY_29725 [Paraburkholderia mimosarum]|uniref:hypothetical protein n=1 Tax=Paraburkholderia mimosarum TaxID=312026 RepID=UPI0039C0BEBB
MKSPNVSRRKLLGYLAAAGVAPIVTACGGGGGSEGGNPGVANYQRSPTTSTTTTSTAFAVTSPAQNSTQPSTFTISGTSGSQWVNVAAYVGNTKVGKDATPSGGKWSISVNMGSLTGAQTLTIMAFSVAAGQSGGTSTSASLPLTISASAAASAVLPFWGVNLHYIQGGMYQSIPLSQQISLMSANGMRTCRQDCYDAAGMKTIASTVVPGMPGVTVLPVVAATPTSGSSVSSAYSQGYNLGVDAANAFAGVVPVVEFGNELNLLVNTISNDGINPSDYSSDASVYVAFQAGMCNGFRSVDTTGKTKVMTGGCTYIYVGFLKMIVQNIQPNGAPMPTAAANFDMVGWHYYYTGGNMESVNGRTGNYNFFTLISAVTNKPIVFTECGMGNPSSGYSTATGNAYVQQAMAQMVANPQVVGAIWYEMYDFIDGYGIYNNSGAGYGWQPALASFIKANPKS